MLIAEPVPGRTYAYRVCQRRVWLEIDERGVAPERLTTRVGDWSLIRPRWCGEPTTSDRVDAWSRAVEWDMSDREVR